MARPIRLTHLKTGKAIAAFSGFVETFNWLVDFVDNLRGDGDLDSHAAVRLDRSDEDHPIIRVTATEGDEDLGPFKWNESTATVGVGGVMVGRRYVEVAATANIPSTCYVSLRVTFSASGSATAEIVTDAAFGAAPTDTQSWIPIYHLTDGKIDDDRRGCFVVPVYE